ncbi:MAG: hypothetical protein WAL34_03910 [Acidobacteriaceae bacterium]
MIATLVTVIILLLVCGMLVWCVQQIPGLPAPIPAAVSVIVVLVFALIILNQTGIVHSL